MAKCELLQLLVGDAPPVQDLLRHAEHGVDPLDGRRGAQQAQPRHAEQRVEGVGHVAGPVREAAGVRVLAGEDEGDHLVGVDPVEPAQHGEAGQHPPAVAHVRQLLGAPVQSAAGQLPLRQPPAQPGHTFSRQLSSNLLFNKSAASPVLVRGVQVAGDGEGAQAGVDEAGVGLGPHPRPEAPVKVLAGLHEAGHLVRVHAVQSAQQGQRGHGAEAEPAQAGLSLGRGSAATHLLSTSPHLSPVKLPSSCCKD